MDRETFTATIQAFQNRRPFKPFTVALVDGDRYEVDRPNVLALGDGAAVLLAPGTCRCSLTTRASARSLATCPDVGPGHPDRYQGSAGLPPAPTRANRIVGRCAPPSSGWPA